jgi:CubicO group peptidase (beta-lactamase class C family)
MFRISILFFTTILLLFPSCETENIKVSNYEEADSIVLADFTTEINALIDSVSDNRSLKVDKYFTNKFKRGVFNGNILFAEKGKVIISKSYGYAHVRNKEKLTSKHTFQLASASKPFTAIATLQLIEQGLLSLDDSVKKFFPEFPYSDIDIHQLLSHRSGMSQYTHFCDRPDSIWPKKDSTITNEDVLQIMTDIVPLINYSPNKRYYYCNTNYLILASIIEKVSGITFEQYLSDNIFIPLGMNSSVVYNRTNRDQLILPAQGYEGKIPWEDVYLNGCVGDKGVYSSVEDLLKFDRALNANFLISDSLKTLAYEGKSKTFKRIQNYGYGFRIKNHPKIGKIVFHTGWWKGFRVYFIKVMKNDRTIIVLNNIKKGRFLNIAELATLLD